MNPFTNMLDRAEACEDAADKMRSGGALPESIRDGLAKAISDGCGYSYAIGAIDGIVGVSVWATKQDAMIREICGMVKAGERCPSASMIFVLDMGSAA